MRKLSISSLLLFLSLANLTEGQTVRVWVKTFDEAGENEIDTINVGERFSTKVFVQDVRPADPLGVFAAYVDVLFDADKLSIIQDPVFPAPDCRQFEHSAPTFLDHKYPYTCGLALGTVPVPGRLDAAGGFSGVFGNVPGPDPFEVFSFGLQAEAEGVATIVPESTSDPDDPFDEGQSIHFGILVYGENDFVCPNETTCFGRSEFVSDTITILPSVDAVCGDFDMDGDVDAADRTIQTVGWTGALAFGEGSSSFGQGDCDGDGDVDTADQTGFIQNWTGAQQQAGGLEDDGDADLVYDPVTGNVKLDASDTSSGTILSFVFATDQDNMTPSNASFPFFDVGTNTDATTFQIGQTDPFNQGVGPVFDLGDVLPAGMDLGHLSEYLTLAEYASELGAGGQFDLVVVPEATSAPLFLLGLVALATRRRAVLLKLTPPQQEQSGPD